MTDQSPSNCEIAKECLEHLGEEKSVLHRATYVLEIVAHSSVGLGEVLQDYAHQAWGQLREVIHVSQNATKGIHSANDVEVLQNAHAIMNAAKKVLEMTPAAMQRNKAATLGEKEKLSPTEILEIAHAFAHSPDIEPFLTSEESGRVLASQLMDNATLDPAVITSHLQSSRQNPDNHA